MGRGLCAQETIEAFRFRFNVPVGLLLFPEKACQADRFKALGRRPASPTSG